MFIPEWVSLLIVLAFLIVIVTFLFLIAMVILVEGIEFYFKRLKHQLGILDVRVFAKDYREWKKGKDNE